MSISGYMKACSALSSAFKMAATGDYGATGSGCSIIDRHRRERNISSNSEHFKLWCTIYVLLLTLRISTCMPPIAQPNPQNVFVREDHSSDTQTRAQPDESPVEQDASARQLLNSFGLKTLPTGSSDPFSVTPTFMLELYNELSKNGSVDVQGRGALLANTVRSFYETETDRGRRNIYEFDISGVLARETVVGAELRLYKMPPRSDRIRGAVNTSLPSMIQVIQWPDAINSSADDKLLLDQRFVEIDYTGLVTFNVTAAFKSFVARDDDHVQKAFRVKVRDYFEEKFHTKKVVKFAKASKHGDRRPLLVLFLQDSAIPVSDIHVPTSHDTHARKKREVQLTREELIKRVKRLAGKSIDTIDGEERRKRQPTKTRRKKAKGQRSPCRLYDFEVDFQRLNWDTWIIAPAGYVSNVCDGYCPYPLDSAFNATNFAIVKSVVIANGIRRRGYPLPRACCVPQGYDNLNVLYLHETHVALKEFNDMIATSCACN